jgi:hypothetical protein
MTTGPILDRCDPQGVMRAALSDPPPAGSRELWFGWVLRLPNDVDAAEAAARLLAACPESREGAEELRELLVSTASCTPARLGHFPSARRSGRPAAPRD